MTTVLIVDDHKNIRNLIEIYLKRDGLNVLSASDGKEALAMMENHKVDLMVVDIMMPHIDGYTVVEELRMSGFNLPILMITAKTSFKDKKIGFDLGIDDYMSKPLDMDELVLRVRALLRRSNISSDKSIQLQTITLDYESLEVRTKDKIDTLPMKEFYLLYKLLSYPNKIFTRLELMDDIWGYDSDVDYRTVDVHIKRLRDRFEDVVDFDIVTVRGLGYKGVIQS